MFFKWIEQIYLSCSNIAFFCLRPSFRRNIVCQNAIALIKTPSDFYKSAVAKFGIRLFRSYPHLNNISFLILVPLVVLTG